ncbi:hypothetical protein [Streptomyces sp. WZ-12]|uniref:hypothetical protein n=1 Tax=Streptomyces sp. WZ-12 TaxID=3030210 RepID=UPI002380C90E|nr:hypothetical protein [Streptomyces sp. WZ-12]
MPQLEYRDADDLPQALKGTVFRERDGRCWYVAALVIHYDRESGQETKQVAFLRRADSCSGIEWEIPLATLYETAEVDQWP